MEMNHTFPDGERIKKHFKENEKLYKGIMIGAVVVLAIRKPVVIHNVVTPVFNNNNSSNVFLGGAMSKIVGLDGTNLYWTSVNKLAEELGVSLQTVSKHLNRHPGYEELFGKVYSFIGVGAGTGA